MFRKLLRKIGLDDIINQTEDQRQSNLQKWKKETDTDFKQKRKWRKNRDRVRPYLDGNHNHDDWTY